MIYGVSINEKHCWNDLKLVLAKKEISAPTATTNFVTVPGRNGLLDLSEALCGEPIYKNRTVKLTFVTMDKFTDETWAELHSQLCNLFHGQKVEIIFDDYPDYKLNGRCTDVSITLKKGKRTIKMTCNCDPFYTKIAESSIYRTLSTSQVSFTVTNNGRPVVPSITVESETAIVFGDTTTTLSAGTWTVPAIRLANGANTIKAKATSGTGKITLTWHEVTL